MSQPDWFMQLIVNSPFGQFRQDGNDLWDDYEFSYLHIILSPTNLILKDDFEDNQVELL